MGEVVSLLKRRKAIKDERRAFASKILSRIYRLMDNDNTLIEIARCEDCEAEAIYVPERPGQFVEIQLDPECEILPCAIHEFLHVFYPKDSEERICELEDAVVSGLSDRQLRNLLIRLGNVVV